MDDLKEEVYKMIKQRMVDAFILLYSKMMIQLNKC